MALNRTIDQMVDAARRVTDTQGTSALVRHPSTDLFDYVNRGIAALDRLLKLVDGGQRYIGSTTITTVADTETYALPADFMSLISLSGSVDGAVRWLSKYEMNERPELVGTSGSAFYGAITDSGAPMFYRLRGANISLLPVPAGVYTFTLWYSPNPSTLTTGQAYDTIARLDDYIVWYAAKEIAKKDRNWELHDRLSADMATLRSEIEALGANRDQSSPARIVDTSRRDRYGRTRYGR